MSFLNSWFGPLYDAVFCPSLPSTGYPLATLGFPADCTTLQHNPISPQAFHQRPPYCHLDSSQASARPLSPRHRLSPCDTKPVCIESASSEHPRRRIPRRTTRRSDIILSESPPTEPERSLYLPSHRYAPRYTFPTAHEDVQDVAEWLIENAERLWGANPRSMSVSGFSSGGNLALGVAQRLAHTEFSIKASVTFYAPIDLRLPPWEKPRPARFPEKDPLAFLQPLMDAYAGPAREKNLTNPLLHPILADIECMPRNMMFVVPKMDILLHEQTVFVERLKKEAAAVNRGLVDQRSRLQPYRIESRFDEGQIHGWLEIPSMFIDAKLRDQISEDAVQFLNDVNALHG